MNKEQKMNKIRIIVNHIEQKTQADNKQLAERGLHQDQKVFDADAAILSLIFCDDSEIDTAYNMIVD